MIEPNTGGMDTSGPPVSLAKAPKAQQGGNLSRGRKEAIRRPHKPETAGSTPAPATDVKPDRRAYDPPAGGRPVNNLVPRETSEFAGPSDTVNRRPRKRVFRRALRRML